MSSGIYKIINIITNDFYIGSAKNFIKRKYRHEEDLRKNIHGNKFLQNSFNKYGEENFTFEILIRCPIEYLIKLEQWFIDNMKPTFNIKLKANSRLGLTNSEEQNNKISLAHKGKSKDFNKNKIISINIKTNKEQEFNSTKEAADFYKVHPTSITRVLTGKRYSNNGYRFKYKDKPSRNNVKLIENNNIEGQKFLKKKKL